MSNAGELSAGGPGPGARRPRAPAGVALEPAERRAVGALAAIYAARMLGLFLLLPVLALYAGDLPGATPLLVGLAVGAYGLTQACFQIPFGVVSDRLGRRPVITVGLVLYGAGSLWGAAAVGIWGVIGARMLQGAGAVSGPVTALLADLTRTQVRTRAMALIGISIGGAFIVSLIGAPLLQAAVGVHGIFRIMAALALLSVLLLYGLVPVPGAATAPDAASAPDTATLPEAAHAFARPLLPYYVGVFMLNFVLTATFVGVPHALRDTLGIDLHDHWATYLGAFVASLAGTVPFILWSERSGAPDLVMRYGIALLVIAQGALAFTYGHYWGLNAALAAFFAAFNFLEARLPARLSQAAGPASRGAALGVFATAQFLGAFAGGMAGGVLYGSGLGLVGVFGGASLAALVWLLLYRPRPARRAS